jgi:hypothetical protein
MIRRVHGYRFRLHSQTKIPPRIVNWTVCSYSVTVAPPKVQEKGAPDVAIPGLLTFHSLDRSFRGLPERSGSCDDHFQGPAQP